MTDHALHGFFDARRRLDDAEERVRRARARWKRITTSHQGPTDATILSKVKAEVRLAENALSRARLAVADYS